MSDAPAPQVPIVDYLALDGPEPHLVGQRCAACGATYLQRRNACGACGGRELGPAPLAGRGVVRSFTVVHRGAPKETGPFVSVVVELDDGAFVKANLLAVAPDAASVDFAAPVHLRTYVAGTDDDGTEAIAFGYAYEGSDG